MAKAREKNELNYPPMPRSKWGGWWLELKWQGSHHSLLIELKLYPSIRIGVKSQKLDNLLHQ